MSRADAAGLIAGYALDVLLGDPRRWHPVGGFGVAAGALERRLYAPNRRTGAAFTAISVSVPAGMGLAAALATRRRPIVRRPRHSMPCWRSR